MGPSMIRGAFHFHSTYSHDGRTSLVDTVERLRGQGFAFVIMTEHFEDFDRIKFSSYLQEVEMLNRRMDFVLIPGIEVNLDGVDTIKFPVGDYEGCLDFGERAGGSISPTVSVLAHPTKYSLRKVLAHLGKFKIDGIELWNQQADGRYAPPLKFLMEFQAQAQPERYCCYFGCDLHDANLKASNFIALPRPHCLDPASLCAMIASGQFTSFNSDTGIAFSNGPQRDDYKAWLEKIQSCRNYKGRVLRFIRRGLRAGYKRLPKSVQRSLNDIKNTVRNKI